MKKLTFDELSITSDFNKWYSNNKNNVLEILRSVHSENSNEELLEYGNKLKEYADGFLLAPVCLYKETPILAKTISKDTFEDIIEFMMQLKKDNKLVFLYMVYRIDMKPTEDDTFQEPHSLYKLRYGVMNE